MNYDYTISPFSADSLALSIQQSAIVTAFDHITALGSAVSIFFKASISDGDKTILDAIVAAHTGAPLPQNQTQNVAVQAVAPFGSKTVVVDGATKKLFARNCGAQFNVGVGTTVCTYTIPFPWVKMIGIEIINSEALDTATLKVLDTVGGTYTGVANYVLNQFAWVMNLPKDFYARTAAFDADLRSGMQIQITYVSVTAKIIGINFILNEVKS
jgi:hypothetical protein